MRKHRFFIATDLSHNQTLELEPDISHQISRVLRLQSGDQIFLFNNSEQEFTAEITSLSRNHVKVQISGCTKPDTESPLQIHLAQVISKGEKIDLVVQKATELGVTSITPLISERSIHRNISDKLAPKLEHWQRVAIAASCQSWRTKVPTILPPAPLQTWINQSNSEVKLILAPDPCAQHLKQITGKSSISLLIGPEGGFSDLEISMAANKGFKIINLGPRILRTETAPLATIAILQALWGDG